MSEAARPHWSLAPASRSFLGFLIAPFVAGITGALALNLMSWLGAGVENDIGLTLGVFMIMALYIAVASLPWAFAIGWPIHVLALRSRKTHILVYSCAGAVLGVIALLAQSVINPISMALISPFAPGSIAFAAIGGFAGAAAFWFIRRPDLDARTLSPA